MIVRKLRIAQIAPLAESIPPKKYGGTERGVSALTEQLVKRGHDVTLFASGDSRTSAKLISVFPRELRAAKVKNAHGLNEWILFHIVTAYKMQDKFDIIHDHNTLISLPTAQFSKTPVVVTLHGPITSENIFLYKSLTNINFVTISHAQSRHYPELKIAQMIYNGLPLQDYPVKKTHKNYLLFVGRISMEKGVHHAITVAKKLRLPLVIAAKVDAADEDYFKKYIKPHLDTKQIRWVGEVDEAKRNKLMHEALCLLHPVTWPEPFGLTLIESMACGTPVVAFGKGSIPEVVQDGVTGFVTKNTQEMISAVKRLDQIDRNACREYVLGKFTDQIMADQYERLYYRLFSSTIMT